MYADTDALISGRHRAEVGSAPPATTTRERRAVARSALPPRAPRRGGRFPRRQGVPSLAGLQALISGRPMLVLGRDHAIGPLEPETDALEFFPKRTPVQFPSMPRT
jgi:hypothetical protein